jgi:hypothetical protein
VFGYDCDTTVRITSITVDEDVMYCYDFVLRVMMCVAMSCILPCAFIGASLS